MVLPRELFKVKENSSSNNTVVSRAEGKMLGNIPFNKSDLKFAEATVNLKRNQDLSTVLEKYERTYQKEYEIAYGIAYGEYLERARPAQAEYDRQIKEQEYQKEIFLAAKNNEGLSGLKYIPVPEVPVFKFDFRPEIEPEHLLGKLSEENTEALYRIFKNPDLTQALKGVSTFTELFQTIEQNNQLLQQAILNNTNLSPQVSKTVGGIVIPVTQSVNTQEISFTAVTWNGSLGVGDHSMILTTDINDPKHIVSGKYNIKSEDQSVLASGTLASTFDAPM